MGDKVKTLNAKETAEMDDRYFDKNWRDLRVRNATDVKIASNTSSTTSLTTGFNQFGDQNALRPPPSPTAKAEQQQQQQQQKQQLEGKFILLKQRRWQQQQLQQRQLSYGPLYIAHISACSSAVSNGQAGKG